MADNLLDTLKYLARTKAEFDADSFTRTLVGACYWRAYYDKLNILSWDPDRQMMISRLDKGIARLRAFIRAEGIAAGNKRMELPASNKTTSQVAVDNDLRRVDSIMFPSPDPFGHTWKQAGSQRVINDTRCEEKHEQRAIKATKREKRKLRRQKARQKAAAERRVSE